MEGKGPLLPVVTVYDKFVERGFNQLDYACYSGARFIAVGVPSGTGLSRETATHQSTQTLRMVMDLPGIVAPTLVIAGEKDLFTPLHRSRKMVSLLPHAELMILAEASHAAIVEHPQTINRRIDRFLDQIEG